MVRESLASSLAAVLGFWLFLAPGTQAQNQAQLFQDAQEGTPERNDQSSQEQSDQKQPSDDLDKDEYLPPVAGSTGEKVAVVAMHELFSNSPEFQLDLTGLKNELERKEKELRARRAELKQRQEELEGLVSGSAEHEQMTRKVVSALADLKAQVELSKKAFLLKEVQIYRRHFQIIKEAIEEYAEEHQIDVVFQIKRPEVLSDQSGPEEVTTALNQSIVFYRKRTDITSAVLQMLIDRHQAEQASQGEQPTPGT